MASRGSKRSEPARTRPVPAHREGRPPRAHPEPALPESRSAERIVQASIGGTALFTVTAVPAAVAPDAFVGLAVAVSLTLFALGLAAFAWAYAVAVGRSRRDLMGIGGLFFLAGSAPRQVQRRMVGSLAVEIVVAVATASVRVYTPLAFGVLVPMYGLGLMGLWGARFGTFPPRPVGPGRGQTG